jgi:hypothetical protein
MEDFGILYIDAVRGYGIIESEVCSSWGWKGVGSSFHILR